MLKVILKISLVAGAAFWILSGNRAEILIGFYTVFGVIICIDYADIQRPKSLLDKPEYDDRSAFEKTLDIILLITMFALGAYVLWMQ